MSKQTVARLLNEGDLFYVSKSSNIYQLQTRDADAQTVTGVLYCRHSLDATEVIEINFDTRVFLLNRSDKRNHDTHRGRMT